MKYQKLLLQIINDFFILLFILGGLKINYYTEKNVRLILGDSFEIMKNLPNESFDMIFADPPYFLSNGGISNSGGKVVSVNKGDWDKIDSLEDKHKFNREWIKLAKNLLKPNGTIWISGTLHNIYSVGMALEQEGFKILNNIIWKKLNPPPNLSCRYFTHSTETILWARKNNKKARHYYNYDLMKKYNGGKQMKDVPTDKANRSFDLAIYNKSNDKLFLLETNYYNGGGSKLKSVCGEFMNLNRLIGENKNISFIWVTDGQGWKTALNPITEAMAEINNILNLHMIFSDGLLKEILSN